MASFTADNANITGQVGTPVDNPIKGVKFAKFVYTIVGTEAATDTITLGTLPTGATIIPQLSYLTRRSDPGTALTIDIGYSGDADYFADGVVCDAAGTSAFTTPVVPGQVSAPVTFTAPTVLTAVVAAATALTANAVLEFLVAFTDEEV